MPHRRRRRLSAPTWRQHEVVGTRAGCACAGPRLRRIPAQFVRHEDDLTGEGVELALGDALGEVDDRGRIVDHAAPADVAAHDADDPVIDRFAVGDHLRAGLEQAVQLGVERLQPQAEIVGAGERAVQVVQAQLVVVVQVVRRRDDADDAAEAVLAQPDDLFLTADATMVLPVAAGALAHGELVFHDPREVARRDAQRPLPAQPGRHCAFLHESNYEMLRCRLLARRRVRRGREGQSLLMALHPPARRSPRRPRPCRWRRRAPAPPRPHRGDGRS